MAEDFSFEAQLLRHARRLKELLPCCPNCIHFAIVVKQGAHTTDGSLETISEACNLDPARGRPPARIIAFGCPAFDPSIPF
jgi:hypothetical protein